jgi:hypothetical protein
MGNVRLFINEYNRLRNTSRAFANWREADRLWALLTPAERQYVRNHFEQQTHRNTRINSRAVQYRLNSRFS